MSYRNLLPISAAFAMFLATPLMAQTATTPPTTPGMGTSHSSSMTTNSPVAAGTTSSTSSFETSDDQIRASKLIGSSVYNDQHQTVGSIDELLMDQNHNVTSAVLSVGGFLGVGSKLVKVPYKNLHIANNTVVMPGASKNELQKMPSYEFNGAG
jgi:sporulation protein YlmC with PRC-barrel domain